MPVTDRDLKTLWGLAAGRCAFPECGQECISFIDSEKSTIIGEMAHIIAKRPDGPRGDGSGGNDTYENLILLCPNHHTEIDKAPTGTYPAEQILQWKRDHESRIRMSLSAPMFGSLRDVAISVKKLLIENRSAWSQYGPESAEALRNPISNLVDMWALRKLDTIVPNNRRIVSTIRHHKEMLDVGDYQQCALFFEHAEGFERNCYSRIEGTPRFPPEFEAMINRHAESQ
ncbi:HNH endonuclease signature motif containing protein [Silanimonas sp.]|jgi:hypothetical protein|uniref:HNH endonuclease signature motif containing protein n=1 Tax=Silanimonas sp. TaxID=1929290 RepID=UPI0037CB7DF1